MANEFDFLSPGIKIREIDESVIPAESADDGPIIIGRTRKGPAMEPIRVKSLDAFIKTFGKPVAGGAAANSDVWRDGPNASAPTYASYAAQAWLASGNGPCTIVRLLGDDSANASGDGIAGWQLSGSVASADDAANSTAYGLFVIDSGSVKFTPSATERGALAAIFYVDSGYMTLNGTALSGTTKNQAATLVKSTATNTFALDIYDTAGDKIGSTNTFNFDRGNPKYIRNVFNTNPQKVNSDMTDASDLKTYWLGETFERHLAAHVTSTGAGKQAAILLPLQRADAATNIGNWSYHRVNHSPAKTGWVISKDEGAASDYDILELAKSPLFRFCSLHGGDELQKEIMIAIEDIRLPKNTNVNAYASFTVSVLDRSGNVLEQFTKCNLDITSTNFIVTKIGDYYAESWNETDKKYEYAGNEPNHSNYIRVELPGTRETNGYETNEVPFGFVGPARPRGFIIEGKRASVVRDLDAAAFAKAFVKGSGSVPSTEVAGGDSFADGLKHDLSASFVFPSIALRKSGSDGNAPNPFKVYWGIRPKLNTSTNINDVDYVDYLRAVPSNYAGQMHKAAGTLAAEGFEPSFIFTLDDIVITGSGDTDVYYLSGSRKTSTSYTAKNGSSELLDKKVRQFVMPLFGGRHGLDITEPEPFRNQLIQDIRDGAGSADGTKNAQLFAVQKAIDAASDPEVVPANLLLAPGFYQTDITNKLMTTAQTRQDVLAIIDIENDYKSVYESKDGISTRRGSVTSAVTSIDARNIDNTFACAFYPAVQAMDPLNSNQRVWLPASVAGLGGIAQSEAASAAWFAPAGFNRGGLGALGGSSGPVVTQARQRLDSDDRDELYESNINPIATFPNEGVVIFGQKTLQAGSDSALSRINVRRLLIYLKTRISAVARNLIFDQNVPSTWARFVGQAEPILADVKARFGLTDYRLVLDETTTTAELIDKNILYAQVYLKPARAIEYIAIDFIVTRTGASFA